VGYFEDNVVDNAVVEIHGTYHAFHHHYFLPDHFLVLFAFGRRYLRRLNNYCHCRRRLYDSHDGDREQHRHHHHDLRHDDYLTPAGPWTLFGFIPLMTCIC
jgi:hypothetical protein